MSSEYGMADNILKKVAGGSRSIKSLLWWVMFGSL